MNQKIFGTENNGIPVRMLEPQDFSNNKYDAIMIYRTADGKPVVVRRSMALIPMPWRVHIGTSTVCFSTRREAKKYCHNRGYTVVYGGEQRWD